MNTLDVVSLLGILLYWSIGAICTCWCCSFYFFRHRKEIESRRPQTSVLVGILCILSSVITHSAFLLFANMTIIPEMQYIQTVLNIFAVITDTSTVYILCFRSYIVYYDIKWNQALQDAEWRLQINPDEKNWFLRYKHTLGNGQKSATFLFIHWSIFTISIVMSTLLNGGKTSSATKVLTGLNGFLPMLYNFILLSLFPKYDDIWSISNEIRATLKITLISFLIYVAMVIIMDIQPYSYQHIIFMTIETFVFLAFACVVFYYPLKKFKLPTNPCVAAAVAKDVMFQRKVSTSIISGTSTQRSELNMTQIIESKQGFAEFARHCSKEFRIESFLFFVETQQWLNELAQKENYKAFANKNILLNISLPRTAPRSSILALTLSPNDILVGIEDEDIPTDEEYLQCATIFDKYVPDFAYFCINIDGPTRRLLTKQFGAEDGAKNAAFYAKILKEDEMTKTQLFHVFDQCRLEIYRLLMSAFTRFKQTHEYQRLGEPVVSTPVSPVSSDTPTN